MNLPTARHKAESDLITASCQHIAPRPSRERQSCSAISVR